MALLGSNATPSGDGALQPRLSTLSTMAMAFAILKYDYHHPLLHIESTVQTY